MTNGKFAEGVAIISKYLEPDGYSVAAEHDQLWFGPYDLPCTDEERSRLLELGWFESFDSWSCFT